MPATFPAKPSGNHIKIGLFNKRGTREAHHFLHHLQMLKGLDVKLQTTDVAAIRAAKKVHTVSGKEYHYAKAERVLELSVAKEKAKTAQEEASTAASVACDLSCQFIKEEATTQWNCITADLHDKDPWKWVTGAKHVGMCLRTWASLLDCI